MSIRNSLLQILSTFYWPIDKTIIAIILWHHSILFPISYKILNPKAVEGEKDPQKCAQVILDAIGLEAELYRLGNTKAWDPFSYFIVILILYSRTQFLPFKNISNSLIGNIILLHVLFYPQATRYMKIIRRFQSGPYAPSCSCLNLYRSCWLPLWLSFFIILSSPARSDRSKTHAIPKTHSK